MLAKNIKNLRKANNMSQVELAEKLHISPQAISKWENKKSIPDMLMIKKIAEIFEVSLESLLGDFAIFPKKDEAKIKKEDINTLSFYEKSFFIPLCVSINLLLLLFFSKFFLFEHSIYQYIILILSYLGLISSYYLFLYLYSGKQKKTINIILIILNIIFFITSFILFAFDLSN